MVTYQLPPLVFIFPPVLLTYHCASLFNNHCHICLFPGARQFGRSLTLPLFYRPASPRVILWPAAILGVALLTARTEIHV